jgi:O-antigen/teichoic acid export membrane protein
MSINSSTLKHRFFHASGWAVGGHMISQVLRLASNLIMTRLLAPDMFGVMAIAYLFITGLSLFSDLGVTQNIVQSPRGNDPAFLHTAWVVKILRGAMNCFLALLVSLGLYLAAAWHMVAPGTVYADGRLPMVLAAISLISLIQGFESNRLSLALRHLNLRQLTMFDLVTQILGLSVMLVWAVLDRSVWALVAGTLAGQLIRTLLSHRLFPGPSDRWAWDAEAFTEIFHFGKWIFISSILGFLAINGDRLVLGGLVSADVLGRYSIAFFLATALQLLMSRLFSAVAFPALSEVVRNTPDKLKANYYKIRIRVDALALFSSGCLFVLGVPIIHILYDQRYWSAGPMLEVLALSLIAAGYELAEQCYLALGLPKWLTLQKTVRMLLLYLGVPIAFSMYQLPGAIWAIVLSMFSVIPVSIYVNSRLGILDVKKELMGIPFFLLGWLCGKLAIWFSGFSVGVVN